MICFLVFYAIPYFLSMMFGNVSSIILSISENMRVTAECQIAPFPTVLILRNTGVHVCTIDGSYVLSNVESAIDDVLCYRIALRIPDINSNYCHV